MIPMSADGVFSVREVLGAGGDVEWVEGEGAAYLLYKFDGLELRAYANASGTGLLAGNDFFIKDASFGGRMHGAVSFDVMEAVTPPSARGGGKWKEFERYLGFMGKPEAEVIEMLGDSYSHIDLNTDGRHIVKDNNGTWYPLDKEGNCQKVMRLPTKVCFDGLEEGVDGMELMKWFGLPFEWPIGVGNFRISFSDTVLYFEEDAGGSLAGGTMTIYGESDAKASIPGTF
jgi:hypothetical protein